MNEKHSREILDAAIRSDGSLYFLGWYLYWDINGGEASLDGDFTADQLEAIAWWMKNKKLNQEIQLTKKATDSHVMNQGGECG